MADVQQVVLDTLAERAMGVLSESVLRIGALLLLASVLAILWTEFRKAGVMAELGEKALEDPKVRWRLRGFSFNVGASAAFGLLLVFLPPLLDPSLELWVRLAARITVAVVLAPIAGLQVHALWKLWVAALVPLGILLFKGLLDRMATWSAQRKTKARVGENGELDIKAEPTIEDPNPKTEVLGRPRQPD